MPRTDSVKLRTRISQAYWCDPAANYEFQTAKIRSMADAIDAKEICWLDQLLQGGIVLPPLRSSDGNASRAVSILVTGPPGTGKTTFATELCYRWSVEDLGLGKPLCSVYLTNEAHAPWLKDNARAFGWEHAAKQFHTDKEGPSGGSVTVVDVSNVNRFSTLLSTGESKQSDSARTWLDDAFDLLWLNLPQGEATASGITLTRTPDVVVLDSLNTVPTADRPAAFREFASLATSGPKILLTILDSATNVEEGGRSEFWEFLVDVIIRLDRKYESGYLIRTIEVVKARYQPHVWGVHQLKIYEPNKGQADGSGVERQTRAHPYRKEGGVFVFPSIHYVLSRYKRKADSVAPTPVECPIASLTKTLRGGFPNGRCIGLVGGRGGHKSHLAYIQVLGSLLRTESEEPTQQQKKKRRKTKSADTQAPEVVEKAIIVTLRDDEGITRSTLEKILDGQWELEDIKRRWNRRRATENQCKSGKQLLRHLESTDRLEISYFPPGYITPEEVFHRILLSISRMKQSNTDTHITLLFNSLDQLSSRFPLCAKEDIFVPGLIQMLSAERITSFFVAAHEPHQTDQTSEYYGLLSMAELILEFERAKLDKATYLDCVGNVYKCSSGVKEIAAAQLSSQHEAVSLKVVRFAGGEPAGPSGILELIDMDNPLLKLYQNQRGLHFVPLVTT